MKPKQNFGEWETSPCKEGRVKTPSSSFWLSTRGDARKDGQPVIIFEAGAGTTGTCWSAVERHLPQSIRTYHYDRAGLGRSEPSAAPRSATNMAAELVELLRTVDVRPPYIVVAHSYGGIISREFLALLPTDSIWGMVFVDANSEYTHPLLRTPVEAFDDVFGKLDYMEISGLGNNCKLTMEETEQLSQDEKLSTINEDPLVLSSAKTLEFKNQYKTKPLGSRPVTAIKANDDTEMENVMKFADTHKIGTAQHREELHGFMERYNNHSVALQSDQLLLSSSTGRFVLANKSGHNVQLTEPQLIADEIIKIVDQVSC
ncbi:Alpha/Beta hydrolase protein [Acrodontium crateriforme]|uniref:Alpha/Beta hydrolase protein n=1 Tax=Acrodontium crateriforme TaxID=150365 RepID=A0AAQ3LZ39_9PEZI|nr:Alpha/Beta hydrolase protein [Acrodontium crateriforme]